MRDIEQAAFPVPHKFTVAGMTLREWYAGMALQGMMANKDFCLFDRAGDVMQDELAASNAFILADAMIRESQKGGA